MIAKRALFVGTLVALATGMTVASAAPGKSDKNGTPLEFSKAPVTMSQAIATAEQQAGGRATRAKLENETGKMLYEIKVAGKDKVTEVKVDAQDGKVLASNSDTHEHKRGESRGGEKH